MASLGNLYFDIKFKNDPKELEEFKKRVLAQLAEVEVSIGIVPSKDELTKTINQVLNEKYKLNLTVDKEEVGAAINNAIKQNNTSTSTQEAEAVSNQAEAYRELESAINSIIGTRGQNIKRLTEEKTALASIQSQLKIYEKQQQSGVILNRDQLKNKASLINKEYEHKQAISELNQLIKSDVKLSQSAATSMDETSIKLARMKVAYKSLSDEMKQSPFGQQLQNQITVTDQALKKADASIGNHQRNVGNYKSQWDGLGFQFQQLARELPSMAYGAKTFFSAISNNLPMFVDEVKKAKTAYSKLKAEQAQGLNLNQKAVSVWKQLIGSIFSWQTAIVAVVTLLTLYGDKLVDMILKTKSATKAHDEFIKSLKDGNSEYGNSIKELTRLEGILSNVDGKFITAKEAVKEYNDSIGKNIGYANDLNTAQQTLIDKKGEYLNVMFQMAMANAYLAEMQKKASEAAAERANTEIKWDQRLWRRLSGDSREANLIASREDIDKAIYNERERRAKKNEEDALALFNRYMVEIKKGYDMAAEAGIDLITGDEGDKKANEPLKERISLLKEAYSTYREFSSLAGKSTALNVVHDTILPGFDPDMYRDEIQKIFDNKSIDTSIRADAASILVGLDKDVLSNQLKETETYISKTIASWDLFKYLFEKSGDYNFSVNAAFGGDVAYKSVADQLINNIQYEIEKSGKKISLDDLILMSESNIKNTFGAGMAAYVKAYQDQNRKISEESLKNAAELLNTHRGYETQRKDIISKGEKDIADLIANGASAEAIEMVNKATFKALDKLQEDVLKEYGLSDYATEGNVSDLFKNRIRESLPLFKNISSATLSELKKAKEAIGSMKIPPQLLVDFKKAGGDAEKLAEIIKEAQDNANEALDDRGLSKVIDSVNKLTNSIGKLGSSLQKFDNKDLKGIGEFFESVSGGMGDILEFAKLGKNAGTMDVVSLGISGVATVIDAATTAIKQNIEAQKEWSEAVEDSLQKMRMYNIEQLAYKESSIFGMDSPIAPAISAIKQYEKAVESMIEIEKELGGGLVQVGTEKVPSSSAVGGFVAGGAAIGGTVGSIVPVIGTALGAVIGGLFGGLAAGIGSLFGSKATTKTVPVFETLKNRYGELFDPDTYELNPKILADYGKMDEETKKIIDNWEEIRQKMVEANEQIEETLKNIAGTIGDDLYNALINAFNNNDLKAALNEFQSSVNKILSDLAAKMLFNAIFCTRASMQITGS